MKKAFFIILALSVIRIQAQTEKMLSIENQIIPFTSPANMLEELKPDYSEFKNLNERMEHYKTPGVSIAVISDYKIDWIKAYGVMDVTSGESVTNESIFEAASTSKFLTAVLVLHFIEKGLFDLDENVNTYLKSWKVPENEFTKDKKVTLRRLLTHQSGLPITNFGYDDNIGIPTLTEILGSESPAMNKPAIPELEPGTQWQYSNIGYVLIQLILEDALNEPFHLIAKKIIFDPLVMSSSTFKYPLEEKWKYKEVKPHDSEGISRSPQMNQVAFAHAGLLTTPVDLAKFTNEIMLSFIGESNKILSHEMTKKLFQNETDLDPAMFGIPISQGLGILLLGDGENLVFAHPGSNIPGLNCWLIGWPQYGAGIVIMTNGTKGELLSMEIINAFYREYIVILTNS